MLYFSISVLQTGLDRLHQALEVAAFVLIPLAGGAVLLGIGDETREEKRDLAGRLITALFLFYIWILICSLFLARIQPKTFQEDCEFYRTHLDLMVNLKPLKTIRLYIRCLIYDYIGPAIPLSNLVGNVVLFMPMSLFLPILFPRMRRFLSWLLTMTSILLLTEALQFLLCCGSCDIDDVLLNLIGALIVYGIFHLPPVQRCMIHLGVLDPVKTKQGGEAMQDLGEAAFEMPEKKTDTAEELLCPVEIETVESVDTLISEEEQGDRTGTSM